MLATHQQKPTKRSNPRGRLKRAKTSTCEATQPTRRQNDQKQWEQHKQMQACGCHQLKKKNDMKKKNVQKNNTKLKKKLGKQIILTCVHK
jgi:hypothetical protein